MRYVELSEGKVDPAQWVKDYEKSFKGDPRINADGVISIDGSVDLNSAVTKIYSIGDTFPVRFGTVTEWFDCMGLRLKSLKGAPDVVGHYFDCSKNQITTLEGGPRRVDDAYFANKCQLKTMVGAPAEVLSLDVTNNQLTSTKGAPKRVKKYLTISDNPIKSLHNIHKDIEYIGKNLYVDAYTIQQEVLGLLMIDGSYLVFNNNSQAPEDKTKWVDIINKYLEMQNMDKYDKVLECQNELIDAGFERLAAL